MILLFSTWIWFYFISIPLTKTNACVRVCVRFYGRLQEPGRTDWPVCGGLPSPGPPQGRHRGGWSGAAQLCWPVRLLQEVHGAVFPTEHWGTNDCPHNCLPEISERVCLENPLWEPTKVRQVQVWAFKPLTFVLFYRQLFCHRRLKLHPQL